MAVCNLAKGAPMSVSMCTVSIPVFIQHLNGLNTVLHQGCQLGRRSQMNGTDLLNMRPARPLATTKGLLARSG